MTPRYIKYYALTVLTLLLLSLAINLLVNPFNLFPGATFEGFNEEKTVVAKYTRMLKAHDIRMRKPKGLVLGSSRAEIGLDPSHNAWAHMAQPIYNLALSSCRIQEALMYLKHAHSQAGLKQVVMGADLFMFDVNNTFVDGFNPDRLRMPGEGLIQLAWIRDMVNSSLSLDALSASLATIRTQGQGDVSLYHRNGMRLDDVTWRQIRAKGGHRAAFLANTRYNLVASDGWPLFSLTTASDGERFPTLDTFRELVRFCLEEGIELRVLISPIHARKLEVIRELGLWDVFEYWKLRLTQIIEGENQSGGASRPATLWDFSGYTAITTEPVPPRSDRDSRMRWYWEGSHYRREVGNIMLDCVLDSKKTTCHDLGRLLNMDNVSIHLASVVAAGDAYSKKHPEDLEELRALIQETERARERLRKRHGWTQPKFRLPGSPVI